METSQVGQNCSKSTVHWRKRIAGTTDPQEAQKQLDDRYRDKDQAVMSAMRRLVSFLLPRGPAHRRIEVIMAGMREERTRLRAVGAEQALFTPASP